MLLLLEAVRQLDVGQGTRFLAIAAFIQHKQAPYGRVNKPLLGATLKDAAAAGLVLVEAGALVRWPERLAAPNAGPRRRPRRARHPPPVPARPL